MPKRILAGVKAGLTACLVTFGAIARNALFPLGVAVLAFGVGMYSVPAGVIVAGIALCVIGWAVE